MRNPDDKPETSSFVVYTGPSMNPTLRAPDLLEVVPYLSVEIIRPGDVIFYQPPGSTPEVVHRVIRIAPDGIITRGDNNRRQDDYRIQPEHITGRVVAAHRGPKRRLIQGGYRGMARHYLLINRRFASHMTACALGPLYRGIARSGIIRRLIPRRFAVRVVRFQNENKSVLRLVFCGHVIGEYSPLQQCWQIQRPFRLIVDEVRLNIHVDV